MRRRRKFSIIIACAMAGIATVSASTGVATATKPSVAHDDSDGDALTAELQRSAGGTARLAIRDSSGGATFIAGSADHPLRAPSADDLPTIGRRFVDRYGALFGVADASTDFVESAVFTGDAGAGAAVKYQQTDHGVPVIAGNIAVQIDSEGAVVSANGEASTQLAIDTQPVVTAAAASSTAIALTARADGLAADDLSVSDPSLWIYDPVLLGVDDALGPRLVWRTEVRSALGDVDRLVLIDAHDGRIALQFSQREDGLNRSVCNNNNIAALPEACILPVRIEGQAPIANAEVNSAYDLSGLTYAFYMANFGHDSVDGAGLPLKSTVRYCDPGPPPSPCPYANAFWNGEQMVYGQGYASADDVVGHELTHGVTQFTSGLFYYADSGAINESMSDVMGEFIDQGSTLSGADPPAAKWLEGEQLPGGAIRNMQNPPALGDPDKMTSGLFWGALGDNRGVHTNSGVNNKAAYLITDGDTFNGQTIVGLGAAKAAKIYFQAESTLLLPGSDYLDLSSILPQACTNIIGVIGITATDCEQVSKAVLATEMGQRATTPGAFLTAGLCPSGIENGLHFADDMEVDNGNWVSSTTGGAAQWTYSTLSSQSGTHSLNAHDNGGPRGISTLTSVPGITIPSGTTFLRFDHSFETDGSASPFVMYDGGVVEYTTDGMTWLDISSLPATVNGYNGSISGLTSGVPLLPNLLAGRAAFGIDSPNYQTTRVELSSLAGQTIHLRFQLGTDNFPDLDFAGWFIDDVRVYSCGEPQAPGEPHAPGEPRSPTATAQIASAIVSWTAPVSDGASPITGYAITPFIAGVAQTSVDTPTTATTFTVRGLKSTSVYTFKVAAKNALGTGPNSVDSNAVQPIADFVSLVPARVLDTRANQSTVDGLFNGIGKQSGGSIVPLTVAGRGGVAANAVAVVLNVTVTEADAPGFVTLYPCGGDPPTASNLNYVAGSTIPNLVVAKIGTNGQVCLFTQSGVHLVADVSGFFPIGSSLSSLVPARLLESRPDRATVDGVSNGVGQRPPGSITEVQVTGRAGIPADASAAVLNVTVTAAQAPGYVTVYPCGGDPPTASNLNYVTGQTIPNAAITKIGAGGRICIYTQSSIDLIADVNGFVPAVSTLVPLVPARLLDSRSGQATIDGVLQGIGIRVAGSVTEVQVTGRAGIPADATAVVLNVTVTEAKAAGYSTVYPCGGDPPTASNLNYVVGSTIANAAITKIGAGGKVCIFTQQNTHILADVNAYFTG